MKLVIGGHEANSCFLAAAIDKQTVHCRKLIRTKDVKVVMNRFEVTLKGGLNNLVILVGVLSEGCLGVHVVIIT